MDTTVVSTTALSNTSDECPVNDLSSKEVWRAVQDNTAWLAGFMVLTAGTGIMFLSFLEACVFVARKIPHGGRTTSLIWIIGIYPAFAVTSLLGLYFPRAVVLCNLTASLYFSVSLYQAWLLFMFYFGDEESACHHMTEQGEISMFLCCKKPTFRITESRYRLLKAGILQVATLQPLILFIEDILWLNGTYNTSEFGWNDAFLYLNFVSLTSTTVALVTIVITYNASRTVLQRHYYITQKFLVLTLALIFANLQIFVLHFLTYWGVIPCEPPFKTTQRANRYQSLILLVESFLVYPVVLWYFRTRKGNVVAVLDTMETKFEFDETSNGYIKTHRKPPQSIISRRQTHNTYTRL